MEYVFANCSVERRARLAVALPMANGKGVHGNGRYIWQTKAVRDNVSDSIAGEQSDRAEANCYFSCIQNHRMETQTNINRQPRFHVQAREGNCFRRWLLLARMPEMLPTSKYESEILGCQGCGKSQT